MLAALEDSRKALKGAEGGEIAVVNILFEGKMPVSGLYVTGRPEETLFNEGHQECTGERDTNITKMCSGDSPLGT